MLQMMQDSVSQQSAVSHPVLFMGKVDVQWKRRRKLFQQRSLRAKKCSCQQNVPPFETSVWKICTEIAASKKKAPKVIERSHRTFKASVGAAH